MGGALGTLCPDGRIKDVRRLEEHMNGFQVYKDIAERTNGEFYLGVCGQIGRASCRERVFIRV